MFTDEGKQSGTVQMGEIDRLLSGDRGDGLTQRRAEAQKIEGPRQVRS